jgi:flavodoxin
MVIIMVDKNTVKQISNGMEKGMKVLVTYMSQSGNTKKLAEAIYEEIQVEKEIRTWKEIESFDGYDMIFVGFPIHQFGVSKLEEIESFEGYDIIFVGFPIHQFGVSKLEKDFLEKHTKDKKIAVFVTHATPPQAPYLQPQLDRCKGAVAEANLVGFFNCQGELSKEIAEVLKKMDNPEMQKFGEMRDITLGHPNNEEVEQSRKFAIEIMNNQIGETTSS